MPDTVWIDDEIEAMSEDRYMVAMTRALKERGIEYEWTPEGKINIEGDPEELAEDALFEEAFENQLRRMVSSDILHRLEDEGKVVSTTDADGEIGWLVR